MLVKDYITNLKEYISASLICLSKPGGLTSTEIAILNRSLIHIMPITGVENYNIAFFKENGLSKPAGTIEEMIEKINKYKKK